MRKAEEQIEKMAQAGDDDLRSKDENSEKCERRLSARSALD